MTYLKPKNCSTCKAEQQWCRYCGKNGVYDRWSDKPTYNWRKKK